MRANGINKDNKIVKGKYHMGKKLKLAILGIVASFLVLVPLVAVSPVYADIDVADCVGKGTLGEGDLSNVDAGCNYNPPTSQADDLTELIASVVNIISLIVGVVAVVMVIWGGLKYITSGGESNKITGAKNTIMYALIGLVIVALAQVIVRFVLKKASDLA